jgi:TolB-like protein
MQAVWPDSFVEESNLTRNISVLRRALNRNDDGPQYIETVPKRGYRFVGELHRPTDEQAELIVQSARLSVVVEEEESDGAVLSERETRTAQQQGTVIGWKLREPSRMKRAGVFATVLLISGVALAVYFRFFSGSGQGPAEIDSLAVLPLVNVGANPDTEYLSDGITDSLLNSLSQLPRLKVMSRNSVMHYKGRETDAQQAGKQLGVRAVLTGRVMPRGDGLSISIELVDARDNSHLWGEQYDRRLSELPAMQAELARDISGKLRRRLGSEDQQRVTKRYTANAEAYDLYLKGRYNLSALTSEGDKKSLEYFQRAIEKDPRYGPAYAGLAEYYSGVSYAVTTSSLSSKEAYAKAKAAALMAVELDDTLAEAHTSLGLIAMLEWDWKGAEREFRRAIALNPNYVNVHHWYSQLFIYVGQFSESLAESQRALELDPLDVAMNFHLGLHYYSARQYDQAIAQLQKTLEMGQRADAHGILGLAYEQKALYHEAIAELRKNGELGDDQRGSIGHVYAVSGQRGEAQKLIDQLQEESKHKSVSPYNIAKIHEGLGENDQAFALLEKAYAERDSNIVGLKVDQQFDRLHSDPRFADLLRRIGLVP